MKVGRYDVRVRLSSGKESLDIQEMPNGRTRRLRLGNPYNSDYTFMNAEISAGLGPVVAGVGVKESDGGTLALGIFMIAIGFSYVIYKLPNRSLPRKLAWLAVYVAAFLILVAPSALVSGWWIAVFLVPAMFITPIIPNALVAEVPPEDA